MATQTIFRNEEKVDLKEVVKIFEKTLAQTPSFSKSEIEELVDIYAKNPTDRFIVSQKPSLPVMQGDLLIWSDITSKYKENINRIENLTSITTMALQEDDSITGDHELVTLSTSHYTLKSGTFVPEILEGHLWGSNAYSCKVLEIDTPFLIKHREHGNIALTAGKYIICSSLDSQTLSRMRD